MLMVNQMTGFGQGWGNMPDLNYASYTTGDFFNQSAQDGTSFAAVFSPDGATMFVLGVGTNTIYQYSISGGNIVSPAPTYSGLSLSVAAQTTTPRGIELSADGAKLYVSSSGDIVYQYTLSTAWSLSGASYSGLSFSTAARTTNLLGIRFSADGAKLFGCDTVSSSAGKIHQFSVGTPWAINTAGATSIELAVWDIFGAQVTALDFSKSGRSIFFTNYETGLIQQMDLPSAWDLTGATKKREYRMPYDAGSGTLGMVFSPDRQFLYTSTNSIQFQNRII